MKDQVDKNEERKPNQYKIIELDYVDIQSLYYQN